MTCRELVELVTEYLEDALPAGRRVRFEEHVAECEGCRAYLAQIRAVVWLLRRLADHPGDLARNR
ncbi:MAG TPA: zf-HC2 domain-containing protein [Solirubrobacteraceae bacterium]|nr:zf-HC2 domain-containing protein [Solirubrobacteraceae bacterium]